MIFDKFLRKEKKKEGTQIGDRFAIRYSDLTTPMVSLEEHPYAPVMIVSSEKFPTNDITDLWTIVEYIGDNQYLDLVTGEVFITQTLEDEIKDTVTSSYNEEALQFQERILENPLAIQSSYSSYRFPNLTPILGELTPERKNSILMETIGKEQEIKEYLNSIKTISQEKIIQFYTHKDKNQMEQYEMDAYEENKRLDKEKKEREQRAKEEVEKKIAEEKRLVFEQRVEKEFAKVFPPYKK